MIPAGFSCFLPINEGLTPNEIILLGDLTDRKIKNV